jgi:hypothetical protein
MWVLLYHFKMHRGDGDGFDREAGGAPRRRL